MEDLLATSTFLPNSWFSILYSAAYHYSDDTYHAMPPQDPQFRAPDVPPPALNPPVHTAISQDWDDFLLDTFGVPNTPIPPIAPIVPTAPRPEGLHVNVLRRSTSANSAHKIYVDPFSTSFISRMYSAQLPGARTPGTQLNNCLRQELDAAIIDTDSNFITSYLFPSSCLPFAIDDALFTKISTPYTTNNGEERRAVWNNIQYQPREFPSGYTEIATAKWFNEIGEALAHYTGKKIWRIWSHRNCEKPPGGYDIKRKPDIILVNIDYHSKLTSVNAPSNWNFIQALCEVTSQEKISCRIIDTINAKSYILFATQHNRRFVIALALTRHNAFWLTISDREGQIRHNKTKLHGKRPSVLFITILAFLMFGDNADLGLDPNVVIDQDGRVQKIWVDNKYFVVKKLIHSVETLIGRATKVWVVFAEDVPDKLYTLKDSWIQESYVESEVSFLSKMSPKLEGHVPKLICGGDVKIKDVKDSTGRYWVDLAGYPYCQRTHRRIVMSTIGKPLTMFRSKKELLNVMISLLESESHYAY